MTRLERTLSSLLFLFLLLIGLVAAAWFLLPRLIPEGGITVRIDRGGWEPGSDDDVPAAVVLPNPPAEAGPTPPPAAATPGAPLGPAVTLPGDTFSVGQPQSLRAPQTSPPAGRLRVPVVGVRPEQLVDTYTQARARGRPHNAIDIAAPRGTPVAAAAAGRVLKLFRSDAGGTTLYQLDPDGHTVYYYAHLDRYARGIREGQALRGGDILGYVGDTGNAGAGNYHLHFGVSRVPTPEQYWGGEDVNPYPLLRGTG